MRGDIAKQSRTCNNCQGLQEAKKSPQIPNATVHLNILGPFVSYGKNKFVVTLTDEATEITVFEAVKSKATDSLAYTIFTHWICRMAVPQVIDNNLDKQQADDLKAELNDYLQQEAPHNPFIDINQIHVTTKKPPTSLPRLLPDPNLDGKILYRHSIWPTTRPINPQLHHLHFNCCTVMPENFQLQILKLPHLHLRLPKNYS